MGLDQYLTAEKHISGYKHNGTEERKLYADLVELFDLGAIVDPHTSSADVTVTVAYWRKANQIHNWFVTQVQDGVDDCGKYYVSREQLETLRALCQKVLKDRNPGLLPPREGFFFGSAENEAWYWRAIQNTVEQLDRVIENESDDLYFYYRSSW